MKQIRCIKDINGYLVPIDKIESICQNWVSAGGSRHDISYDTYKILLKIFEEVKLDDMVTEGLKNPVPELKESEDEQESSEWSEDDEFELECLFSHLRNYLHKDSYIRYENWLKSLKDRVLPQPRQEWSDVRFTSTLQVLEFAHSLDPYNQYGKDDIKKNIDWLKSLRPQNSWKPSKEQLEALKNQCINTKSTETGAFLCDLYYDLMKL